MFLHLQRPEFPPVRFPCDSKGYRQRMETWDAIRARRNVREYTDQPIPRKQLEQILEAGRRAPSASNWQPWDFVVVTEPDQLRDLSEVWQGARHIARSAATIALIAPTPRDEGQRDRTQ